MSNGPVGTAGHTNPQSTFQVTKTSETCNTSYLGSDAEGGNWDRMVTDWAAGDSSRI